MNAQWSTAENMMTLGTTVSESRHTMVYCKSSGGLGSTVTWITVYSKLLVMQYGCLMVHFGEWDANGDYCDL